MNRRNDEASILLDKAFSSFSHMNVEYTTEGCSIKNIIFNSICTICKVSLLSNINPLLAQNVLVAWSVLPFPFSLYLVFNVA